MSAPDPAVLVDDLVVRFEQTLAVGGVSSAVAGHDVRSESLAVRSSIGYIPQAISVDGALTARENLDFYARVTGVPGRERKARIEQAIASMQLDAMLDRLARTLSGGMLLMLGTAGFACMSMLLAAAVKERERFMGIGQLIMMPLFFASSALYPLSLMPGWLHVIARVNPLTYEVQGLRQMLVFGGPTHPAGEVWLDFLVVFGFFAVMLAAATRAYPKAIL